MDESEKQEQYPSTLPQSKSPAISRRPHSNSNPVPPKVKPRQLTTQLPVPLTRSQSSATTTRPHSNSNPVPPKVKPRKLAEQLPSPLTRSQSSSKPTRPGSNLNPVSPKVKPHPLSTQQPHTLTWSKSSATPTTSYSIPHLNSNPVSPKVRPRQKTKQLSFTLPHSQSFATSTKPRSSSNPVPPKVKPRKLTTQLLPKLPLANSSAAPTTNCNQVPPKVKPRKVTTELPSTFSPSPVANPSDIATTQSSTFNTLSPKIKPHRLTSQEPSSVLQSPPLSSVQSPVQSPLLPKGKGSGYANIQNLTASSPNTNVLSKPVEYDIHQYEWEYTENVSESPSEDDFCFLCKKILNAPMLTECCGTHFCRTCIGSNIHNKVLLQCPNCKQQSVICILNKAKWRSILKLRVKCSLRERGCEWTGLIQDSLKHLALECQYMDVECNNGCGESIERHELAEHLEKFCSKRQVTCEYCKEEGELEIIKGDHLLKCPDFPIACSLECGEQFKRTFSENHTKECPQVEISCPYRFVGCDVIRKRSAMPSHLEKNCLEHGHLQSQYFHSELKKQGLKLQHQEDREDKVYINYDELRSEILTKFEDSSQLLLEQLTVDWMQMLKKNITKGNKMIAEVKHQLTYHYVHLEHTVKHIVFQLPSMLWEVDSKEIQFESRVVSGQFNEVWKGKDFEEKPVAIKKHKPGSVTSSKFLQEALTLKHFDHVNIIKLIGVCTSEEENLIVTEFMIYGSLLDFFKNEKKLLTSEQQIDMIEQAASGMAYLESMKCVHRAVSSRSLLIGENFKCKVGSFSLAKILKEDEHEYNIPQGERVQIKWSAPEVLIHNKCSTKSDVWSFGVLQYEIMTSKAIKMLNAKAECFILSGSKFECPPGCSDEHYDLITRCMSKNPDSRPSFDTVILHLSKNT